MLHFTFYISTYVRCFVFIYIKNGERTPYVSNDNPCGWNNIYNIYIHRHRPIYIRTHFAVFKFDERFLHSLPFCTYNFINIFNMPIRSWHNAIQLKHPQNTHSHTHKRMPVKLRSGLNVKKRISILKWYMVRSAENEFRSESIKFNK